MRTLLALLALSLAACGDSTTGSGDAAVVTELPDGAPCPSGTQFCGGTICLSFVNQNNCGACGVRCGAGTFCAARGDGTYYCRS